MGRRVGGPAAGTECTRKCGRIHRADCNRACSFSITAPPAAAAAAAMCVRCRWLGVSIRGALESRKSTAFLSAFRSLSAEPTTITTRLTHTLAASSLHPIRRLPIQHGWISVKRNRMDRHAHRDRTIATSQSARAVHCAHHLHAMRLLCMEHCRVRLCPFSVCSCK
jgi:hypothetical protein